MKRQRVRVHKRNLPPQSSSEDSHYEGDLLMVSILMSSQVMEEAETQRENIFHSRCLVMGGSSANVASFRLVEKLSIPTFPHPKPYKLQWLSERGDLVVEKQDEIVCDVVPMEATYILLGKPLVTHDGVTNKFTFEHMGQKVVLKPLSP
ncbi:hypothetical protein CR513_39893, partial [Mucuna pruriens]